MSRWIDADALKEFLGCMRAELNFFSDEERPRYEAYSKALYILNEQLADTPSIDLVRCKECRHWNSETNGCKRNPSVEAWRADDFCSYGERRER